jgi:ADP-ribosyl-[dinitrogen reductase] hydrolase
MLSNRQLLQGLAASGGIQVRLGSTFSDMPRQLPTRFDFGRIEGMMLGLAIGDALGNTTESCLPAERHKEHGEIRDYLNGRGYPSDDSQLAFWTLEQLIAYRGFVPERVVCRFGQGHIFGIGSTVRKALIALKGGSLWQECGQPSAGNGALMRIAPALIPHLRAPSLELWADAALCAMITHNDSVAIASAVAFVVLLWELLAMDTPPPSDWWLSRFAGVLRDLECGDVNLAKSPGLANFQGPLWKLLEQELPTAYDRDLTVLQGCNRWYSGAYLLETVPCVLYTLMRHGNNPEEAIVRAVNDTWDNDTVAAIVGAAVGALYGRTGLPRRWIEGLSGRTADSDDGRMFELLAEATKLWG